MDQLKVILLCGSRFAIPVLKELAFANQLAAVAIPRSCEEMIEQVEIGLAGSNIPILILDKKEFADQLCNAIETHRVNMGLVMTFGYKIPASVYQAASRGFYNVHPGPLPGYRGADPIFRQIKNQEKQAGVTIHRMSEDFDAGPVVLSEMIKLDPNDSYGMLTTRLADLAAGLCRILVKIASYDLPIPSRSQDESKAIYYKKQGANEISIDWKEMDASMIIALINACNPWNKGAVSKINNQIIRLIEGIDISAGSPANAACEPGMVLSIDDDGMTIATINGGALRVTIVFADEGFMSAGRLDQIGVRPGNCFENL
jgi:methionyl-tRNA formyltransferase